ncbi:phytanoyl-CoA dioxygenase family protein [Streptomyces sp. CMB-StM0423]|uniref:phytanoyl-CoA dioxygenase family protein n=1 Tax=Streptomyces sp. CMB-StM0423 TaxID=2059884 RepID=UPI000C70DE6A|nr:phytanoyl-CoA dioxygenase family protein [Streptomyces sp. CMB-StM0423]AUH41298.1 phytanoyl-CoA dioxygenase [Streptomyces sp. CMB-StM0423]
MVTSNGYVLDESPRRLGELRPVPDAERGDREALWTRLRREGYLWLRGVLDPGGVREFRRFYFAHVDPEQPRGEQRAALFGRVVPGREYAEFCAQPAVRDWYAWFLGGGTFLHRRKILRHTRPGEAGVGTATQAHYDLVYLREGTDRVLSSWIPLGDCPVELGGLVYLERSHVRVLAAEAAGTLKRPAASITADLPALAEEYDARWLLADYAAGDMVVHSAHMVHASLDNTAATYRLSTDIRHQRADQPIDWRWQEHWHDLDGL